MTECGLTHLASCLPEKLLEYFTSALNGAVEPLLNLIRNLLTQPVNVDVMMPLWAIIIYMISMFYGLYFLWAGFNLMISGYDAAKRERAKNWLRNVVLMIIFVQGSFFLYSLALELGSSMTAGVMSLIDPHFFLLTTSSTTNLGLYSVLLMPYIFILVVTLLLLGLRYLLVMAGVVFLPLGIFFYFIPALQNYGKMIINALMVLVFITFFDGLLLFAASAMLSIPVFDDFKIVLTTVAFCGVSLLMILILGFAILKAAFSVISRVTKVGIVAKVLSK